MRLHSPAITGSLTLSSSVMAFNGSGIQIGTAGNNTDQPLRVNNRIMIHQDSGGAGDSELHFDRRHDGADARIKVTAGSSGAYATQFEFVTTGNDGGGNAEATQLVIGELGDIYSNVANAKISGSSTSTGSFGQLHLIQDNAITNPTINFGDGDSGFYEASDDVIRVAINGGYCYAFHSAAITGNASNRFGIQLVTPTSTLPTFTPVYSDADTGIGYSGNDTLTLIAGGLTGLEITGSNGNPIISGSATSTGSFGALIVNGRGGYQKVGIGTSSPEFTLDIQRGNDDRHTLAEGYTQTRTGVATINLLRTAGTVTSPTNVADIGAGSGTTLGNISFGARSQGGGGSNYHTAAGIKCILDGNFTTNDAKGALTFYTKPENADGDVERMRISSAGDVGIGTDSPAANLHLEADEPEFFIKNTGTDGDDTTTITYGDTHGQAHAKLFTKLKDDSSGGAYDSEFHIQTAAGGTLADRIVVDADGNTNISGSGNLYVVRSGAVTDNTAVYLSDFSFTKTGGDADQNTSIIGLRSSTIHNDSNSGFSNIVGGDFYATNTQNKNSAGNGDNIIAVGANASHVAGIVNTVNGLNTYVNVDAGTIDQYVVGNNITLDIENGVNITGNVYGEKIYMDVDDTNAAEVWGIEIDNASSANWDGYINASKGTGTGYAISGSALSTGSFGKVYAATYVERPTSPAFQITSNATSENTDLALATTTHVTMSREVFDNGGNVANSVFTAPVTGKYQLQFTTKLLNIDSAGTYVAVYLFTSNRTYTSQYEPDKLFSADSDYHTIHMQALCDMDAGDTAYIGIRPQGGTAQMDLEGDSGASVTHFSGFLI